MPSGNSSRRRAGMHSSIVVWTLVLACALAASAAASIAEAPRLSDSIAEGRGSYVPGEAIVRFEPGTDSAERRAVRRGAGVDFDSTLGLPRAELVEVEGSVLVAVGRLEDKPGVAYAQPNYRYETAAVEPPDDTFFPELWGLSDPALPNPGVGILDAWESNRGAGQVIAVVDTGVDLTHPDLLGNLWTNPSPGPEGDLRGFDFVDDDGDPDDYNFHGTHVAGTAAASADNTQGIAGVAPEAEIMAIRVLDGNGSGSTDDIAAGIVYAAEHEAGVINLSLGGPAGAEDEAMEDAIELAATEGAVVVAAAGNEGVDNDDEPHSPCVLPQANLICVAALNQSGALAGFSNYGAESVDLAAPGTSILSAKTDYGPNVFEDGFESGLEPWETEAFDGGVPWGASSSAASGSLSATDSPGGNYGSAGFGELASSEFFTDDPVDLTGERGCRVHFRAKYEIEPFFDAFLAGAFSEAPFFENFRFDGTLFDGTSPGFPGSFAREEASVSKLDGRSDVHPIFGVVSDESVELDGAYVDDVRLFCRDETYEDEIVGSISEYDLPESGNYVHFNGTSMATPHVAGVVALVLAAAPALSAEETVDAVLAGVSAMPQPSFEEPTATFGIADACQAIALATGGDVETECPASSEPTVPEPPEEEGDGGPSSSNDNGPQEDTTPVDRVRPRTFLRKRPGKVVETRGRGAWAVFRFGSNESRVKFLCRVDRGRWRRCPARFVRWFRLGPHVLRVKARDAAGNVDRTPAVYRFRVERVR